MVCYLLDKTSVILVLDMIATSPTRQSERIQAVFAAQQAHQYQVSETTATERIAKLKRIRELVLTYQQQIRDGMYAEFRKPAFEVDMTDIYVVTSEIKYFIRHLKKWMRPKRVGVPLAFLGASSWIQYEPKGVCLIISPWNFPLQLALKPIIAAVAAGNTFILKPSELTPHTSAMLRKIFEEIFPEEEGAVFEGAVETATELLSLPFNHIYFTGSPRVGKIVMSAAAKHLASVTLELGGKSPTIVDETADLTKIAGRLLWGKFANTGQLCVAPDHIYVHESVAEEFNQILVEKLNHFYGTQPEQSESFGRLIDGKSFGRLKAALDGTVAAGGRILAGGELDEAEKYVAPTLIDQVTEDSPLMQQEIFGPIMPLMTYSSLDEVIKRINERERPLTMYIYSRNTRNIKRLLRGTRTGTTAINNSSVHFYNHHMPFGGINNSGIGKGHGRYGFEAFSNLRGVYRQNLPPALEILFPPYNAQKLKLGQLIIKWF